MHGRILIVEDSATQAAALSALLEAHGYTVDQAPSGERALELLTGERYALVLSDVMMPGMSGYDLCRRIRDEKAGGDVPVVLLTSLTDPLDIVRGLECGADNYVTKPYEEDQLLARVRNVIDRPKLRRNVKASMGVTVTFLDTSFSITADKEQILDLFIASVEDVVRTNHALRRSQMELARAQQQLEAYADQMAYQARVSSEKYATLMANAQDGIFVLDESGAVVEANVRALKLLGQPIEAVRQHPLHEFVRGGQQPLVRATLDELRSVDRVVSTEVWFTHVSGSSTCCDLAASRSRVGDESLLLVIVHDVTEHKRVQDELRRNSERLQLALDSAEMAAWEYEVKTGELRWSAGRTLAPRGVDTRGQSTTEDFIRLVHPEDRDRLAALLSQAGAGNSPRETDFRLISHEAEPRWMHAKGRGVADSEGEITRLVGVIIDITARRRLESQLQQAQKMEAVGQLAGGIAHDFNNMLTAIISYGQLIAESLPPDEPVQADVREIKSAADRAAALTRQLLAFSRQQVMQPRVLALNDTVSGIEKLIRRLIPENIDLRTVLDPALGAVHADPGQLEQVLVNLAVNARDAMPGGGTLTLETVNVDENDLEQGFDELPPGAYVMLTVSDTGLGIDPENQARIFDPFFTTKGKGQGTGLGLATVYGIIKQSGGHISVHSQPGEGATFRIYLPRVDRPIDDRAAKGIRFAHHGGAEVILLVEDDSQLRGVTRRILQNAGYTVIEASSGEEALEICASPVPAIDLLLSDVVMPKMTGLELAHRVLERQPGAEVLLMSGYTADTEVQSNLFDPGVPFLDKPFDPERLTRKVREVLDR